MNDTQVYVEGLHSRTMQLESFATTLFSAHETQKQKEKSAVFAIHETLSSLRVEIDLLDTQLHLLAKEVEHFVKTFQQTAPKEVLTSIERRLEVMKIDTWITKKEFKKMLSRIE